MKTNCLLRHALMACLAATLFTAIAEAQPGGGGRGGRGGFGGFGGGFTISRAQLLGSEDVQAELKIGDGQSATITAALEAYREERNAARPDFGSFRDMSEEERTKAFEKMRKDGEALNKKTDEVLNALLEPEQIKRLDQIAVQARLRMAMTATLKSDEMRKELSITDEQLAKVDEIETAAAEARRKMFEDARAAGGGRGDGNRGAGGGDPRAAFEKSRQEMTDKVMAVLNDDQKKKLDELKGKEFELDMRSLMGGGRGGRGGAGGRGGDGGGRGNRGDGNDDGGRRRPAQDDSNDAI
ncbi:MAG: Spy/CpxP family protein refolding chaperone [Planctomycetaceae bacterium]